MEKSFSRRAATIVSASASPELKAAGERRFAPRRKSQIPAQVFFDSATVSVPCLIKDMSTTGATLVLRGGRGDSFDVNASEMPRIRLVIRADRVMYDCKVIRFSETELGVRFMAAPKSMTKVVR